MLLRLLSACKVCSRLILGLSHIGKLPQCFLWHFFRLTNGLNLIALQWLRTGQPRRQPFQRNQSVDHWDVSSCQCENLWDIAFCTCDWHMQQQPELVHIQFQDKNQIGEWVQKQSKPILQCDFQHFLMYFPWLLCSKGQDSRQGWKLYQSDPFEGFDFFWYAKNDK